MTTGSGMTIGLGLLDTLPRHERAQFLNDAGAAGLDHVVNCDHLTFRGGWGTDGLIASATDCGLHPSIGVYISVYLLALRHPVLAARELSTLAETGAGRIVLGVGIGGDDRHEVESAGVDPGTRGRRMNESLGILRALLHGDEVTVDGEFFQLDAVRILPTPVPPIPLVVGGRSDAAVQRAGRLADGWIGVWNSAARFARATEAFARIADEAGRPPQDWHHTMQIWCGMGSSRESGRERVRAGIEGYVKLPYEDFENYCAAGRAEDIAEFFQPYLQAGCRNFNIVGWAGDPAEAAEIAGEVATMLRRDVHVG